METIAILTFSFGSNYGGTLQCVGLYKSLIKDFQKKIVILNYIPDGMYNWKLMYFSNIKTKNKIDLKKLFIRLRHAKKTIKKFDIFRKKEMNITKILSESEFKKIAENYEYIIVGSDQVWNVGSGFRENYFLKDIRNPKKISYAACSGQDFFYDKDKKNLQKSLEDFEEISVRNEHTQNFVKRLVNKNVKIVCDPSILYDYKEYLVENHRKEKYILTYILGKEIDGGHIETLKRIKEKYKDTKIIAIGVAYVGSGGLQFYSWADEVLYDASPEEWLNLINNAEFIYTDSYHGVLFSMKFHKPFLAYYAEKARASRFMDLGKRYQVSDYIVANIDEIDNKKSLEKKIDYKKIDNLLEEHRQLSIKFLKNALGEE